MFIRNDYIFCYQQRLLAVRLARWKQNWWPQKPLRSFPDVAVSVICVWGNSAENSVSQLYKEWLTQISNRSHLYSYFWNVNSGIWSAVLILLTGEKRVDDFGEAWMITFPSWGCFACSDTVQYRTAHSAKNKQWTYQVLTGCIRTSTFMLEISECCVDFVNFPLIFCYWKWFNMLFM